jgi:hypothetical protein
MAKKTLTERFVQNTVAERLNREYYRRKPAYVNTEVYTRLKRADVFIAFMRAPKRPYVVVIEAKSRTTIHQLKLKENPDKVRWTGRAIAIALIVGLSAALGYQWYFNALNTLLLLGLFVFGASLITAAIRKLELNILGSIGAIEQLGRYPANEKWIAIGEDSIAKPEEYQRLRKQCSKNGIGLIVVTTGGKLQLKEIPEPRHTFNNYLDSYGKETAILKAIDKRGDYGPTPPERRKFRRQMLNSSLLIGVIGFLGLLAYEENFRPVVPDPFEDSYTFEEEEELPEEEKAAEFVITDTVETGPLVDSEEAGAAGAGEVEEVGCETWSISQRSFLVVDAILNSSRTKSRLRELAAAGIPNVNTVPTDCLNSWPSPGRQTIYIGGTYPNRPAAKAAARAYRELLKEKGIMVKFGNPVKVRP